MVTDLFTHLEAPKPKRSVGYGNAMFLHDLATGVSDATMRAKYTAGEYPDLHRPSLQGWRKLAGRRS
jgi:hypothetical protein